MKRHKEFNHKRRPLFRDNLPSRYFPLSLLSKSRWSWWIVEIAWTSVTSKDGGLNVFIPSRIVSQETLQDGFLLSSQHGTPLPLKRATSPSSEPQHTSTSLATRDQIPKSAFSNGSQVLSRMILQTDPPVS